MHDQPLCSLYFGDSTERYKVNSQKHSVCMYVRVQSRTCPSAGDEPGCNPAVG